MNRSDFPILKTKVNNKPLVYLDNAATTQKPKQVIDKLTEYYTKTNSNIHRGIHHLSEKATQQYENSKEILKEFVNADSSDQLIYTRNTTESLNLVAYSWARKNLKKGDAIVTTEMEHHSNIVPWQLLAEKKELNLKFIPVKKDYTLDLEKYKTILKNNNVQLVTFMHVSNVLGTVNDAKEIIRLAHENDAIAVVDGAQSAPHMKVDVTEMDADFYAFSSHKMCGPTGIGVLYGKKKILEEMPPFLAGGDMIETVTLKESTWNKLPWKFEAGTPDIADGIAFGEAVKYLQTIGIDEIHKHEQELIRYAIKQLSGIKGLKIFGQSDISENRAAVAAFHTDFAHPHDIAQLLNEEGIAVRSGNHCAQPLHKKFNIMATARASFYFYNEKEEIDKLIEAIKKVKKFFI